MRGAGAAAGTQDPGALSCAPADDIFTAIRIAKEFNLDYVLVHGTEGHLITRELLQDRVQVLSGPFLGDRCKPELRI